MQDCARLCRCVRTLLVIWVSLPYLYIRYHLHAEVLLIYQYALLTDTLFMGLRALVRYDGSRSPPENLEE